MTSFDLSLVPGIFAVSFFAACLALATLRVLDNLHARSQLDIPRVPYAAESSAHSEPAQRNSEIPGTKTASRLAERVPVAAWRVGPDQQITWMNRAYLDLTPTEPGKEPSVWPPAEIFPADELPPPGVPGSRRMSIQHSGQKRRWFEINAYDDEDGVLYCARGLDRLVQVETDLRNFRQTLTNTFAQLSVGLGVFDDDRRLIAFNPALADLTRLEPEWLSNRPTLAEFLDRLRDRNMLPEPKDYKEWRNRVVQIDNAATDGALEEDWALPSGECLRVRGRPHHDGGVAFTFEDVTAELSLTRRFRDELELGQAILDALGFALVTISPTGTLLCANEAYGELWGDDAVPDGVVPITILDAIRLWQSRCDPSPIWGEIRDSAMSHAQRAAWTETVRLSDGRGSFDCRVTPLRGGVTMVAFDPLGATPEFQHQEDLHLAG